MEPTFSLKAVVKETGLSAHTIRAWERRYGALSPDRTATNRRVYRRDQVERLNLLRSAVEAGHSIGMIATLSTEQLESLVPARSGSGEAIGAPVALLDRCIRAARELDADSLDSELSGALAVLGVDRAIAEVVLPLLSEIDHGWSGGRVTIAQEHLVSAVLRVHLERMRVFLRPRPGAPSLIVSTPAGNLHELGALVVSVVAGRYGWRTTYLGPNLPADEIASAAAKSGADAVALSVVYPEDDPRVADEFRRLRQSLPDTAILVGGRAAASYGDTLESIGAVLVSDLGQLHSQLEKVRI